MGRAGNGIFIYSGLRRKKARYEIDAAARRGDDIPTGRGGGKYNDVRVQVDNIIFTFQHHHINRTAFIDLNNLIVAKVFKKCR